MATPAQAAAATVGAGSLAAAGAYGITQAVNGSGEETTTEEQESPADPEVPTPVTFTLEETFADAPYNGKLISLIKTTNLTYLVKPENNDQWWSWAFENKFPKDKQGKNFDDLFRNVSNSETLKTACNNAYKADKDKYKFEESDYLLENISSYCTKNKIPFDISEPKSQVYKTAQTDTYKNGVLSLAHNSAVLVKKDNANDNDYWWKWAYKNLFRKNTTITKKDPFTNVNSGYETSAATALNNACDAAYKKNYSELKDGNNNSLLIQIQKFCSSNPSVELKLPEPHNPTVLAGSEDTYSTQKLVKKNTSKLVNPDNSQDWWNWVFDNHYPKSEEGKTNWSDSFKHVTSGHSASAGNENQQSALNQACKEAYKKEKSSFTSDTKLLPTIKKFCSPSAHSSSLLEPDN